MVFHRRPRVLVRFSRAVALVAGAHRFPSFFFLVGYGFVGFLAGI